MSEMILHTGKRQYVNKQIKQLITYISVIKNLWLKSGAKYRVFFHFHFFSKINAE